MRSGNNALVVLLAAHLLGCTSGETENDSLPNTTAPGEEDTDGSSESGADPTGDATDDPTDDPTAGPTGPMTTGPSDPTGEDETTGPALPVPVCGDGEIGAGETCDDGNTEAGDGCDSMCQIEVPEGWSCDPMWYGTADGCDCGCGVQDADCASADVSECEFCPCSFGPECSEVVDPADTTQCLPGTCGNDVQEAYELCDGTTGLDLLKFGCTDLGYDGGAIACAVHCGNFDLSGCTGGVDEWTCPVTYYGTGDGCDCGCGIVDPDCADANASSCEYCAEGGCATVFEGCLEMFVADDNTTCIAT